MIEYRKSCKLRAPIVLRFMVVDHDWPLQCNTTRSKQRVEHAEKRIQRLGAVLLRPTP